MIQPGTSFLCAFLQGQKLNRQGNRPAFLRVCLSAPPEELMMQTPPYNLFPFYAMFKHSQNSIPLARVYFVRDKNEAAAKCSGLISNSYLFSMPHQHVCIVTPSSENDLLQHACFLCGWK